MASQSSYNSSTHAEHATELQRLQNQALLSWDKEARRLIEFGLRDGMSVLEIGSGPGFITRQLLDLLPTSLVTAVEPDSAFLETARQHLRARGEERVRLVQASATTTGLPDNAFDFVLARLVFQHLPEPLAAARELFRVLRPEGKLVITDADHDLWGVLDPPVPELQLFQEQRLRLQAARGGDRRIGRRLCGLLRDTGFRRLTFEAIVAHSDEYGIGAFLPQLEPSRMHPLVEEGLISQDQFRKLEAARVQFLGSPRPLVLLLLLMACGEKPAAANGPSSCTR
jgi:SAM-dependent methyltransferase